MREGIRAAAVGVAMLTGAEGEAMAEHTPKVIDTQPSTLEGGDNLTTAYVRQNGKKKGQVVLPASQAERLAQLANDPTNKMLDFKLKTKLASAK